MERQVTRLKEEVSCKNELITYQEKRLNELMAEIPQYGQQSSSDSDSGIKQVRTGLDE